MAIAIDMMGEYGVDSMLRKDYFNHYGFNRNNILYYSDLYCCCEGKKNTLRISSSTLWRFSGDDSCKCRMSDNVEM